MTGTELLIELKQLFPESKKVLLTAYADTEAAIAAINDVGLDHYLMKPWDPPEQKLYPVLDDLLQSWASSVRMPFEGVRIVGSKWSPQSYATREFLSRNQIPYKWIDIEQDAPNRELVISIAGDTSRLPVVLLADGSSLIAPTNFELAEKVGLQTSAKLPFYDVVIVGGGPAGLASAVYAASEGLKALLRGAQRTWRPGGHQFDDRELSWFSLRRDRRRSRPPRDRSSTAVRGRATRRPKRRRHSPRGSMPVYPALQRRERFPVTRWFWPPEWRCASSKRQE